MKKLLAICSIFFTVCASFTSCGSSGMNDNSSDGRDESYYSNGSRYDDDRYDAEDYVSDALSGIGDAGDDMIEGVTDAADDIIDGFDGRDDSKDTDRTQTTTKRYRDR